MKIAVFGGAFDPLHKEHVRIIDEARSTLKMDKVILLPTYNPPHKEGASVSYDHRLEMLKIFAKTRDFVIIDETERQLNLQKSYAYIILAELKKKYVDDELYYLIGSDSLRKFESWAHPEKILESVKIRVIARGDDEGIGELSEVYSNKYGGDVSYGFRAEEESSSSIRLMLELQRYDELKGRVLPEILNYILEKGLYSKYAGVIERLRATLSPRTFAHSLRVAEFAVNNAWRVWEDYDRAMLAGLLHDCAKGMPPIKALESYDTPSLEVIHQYDGALVARRDYEVVDHQVLDAIRYHTTGKPNFSNLGKLIFLSDKLESGRDYPCVDELRKALVEKGVDEAFKLTLKHNVEYLRTRNLKIDLLTLSAYEWYNK